MYIKIEDMKATNRGNVWFVASYWTAGEAEGGTMLHREQHRLFIGDAVPDNLPDLVRGVAENSVSGVAVDQFRKVKKMSPDSAEPANQFKIDHADKMKLLDTPGLSDLVGFGWDSA